MDIHIHTYIHLSTHQNMIFILLVLVVRFETNSSRSSSKKNPKKVDGLGERNKPEQKQTPKKKNFYRQILPELKIDDTLKLINKFNCFFHQHQHLRTTAATASSSAKSFPFWPCSVLIYLNNKIPAKKRMENLHR